MTIYGYARVSTQGQSLDSQLAQLAAVNCDAIFREKLSGATTKRPQLLRLLRKLRPGDTLIVTRLDRLARSVRDMLNILDHVNQAGASFRSLADSWADTSSSQGRLIITIIGALAEWERELIRDRTSEGRARAIARGVRLGRRPKLTLKQRNQAVARLAAGEPLGPIAHDLGVSETTISRLRPRALNRSPACSLS